jgi:hypothetical protein
MPLVCSTLHALASVLLDIFVLKGVRALSRLNVAPILASRIMSTVSLAQVSLSQFLADITLWEGRRQHGKTNKSPLLTSLVTELMLKNVRLGPIVSTELSSIVQQVDLETLLVCPLPCALAHVVQDTTAQ